MKKPPRWLDVDRMGDRQTGSAWQDPGRGGVWSHSRDGQGTTRSLKWGSGLWRGAAVGQDKRTGPMQGAWDSGAHGEGQEDRGRKGI